MAVSAKQREYYETLRGKNIPSRGIPADEQLWFPRHDKVKDALGISGNPFDEFGADWTLDGVLMFIFPKDYQEKQYKYAREFMRRLLHSPDGLESAQIGDWMRETGVSKATFYNKIVPRLKRVGMISAERKAPRKGAGYIIKPSLTFHNYLFKMAKEWQRIVKTARAKTD